MLNKITKRGLIGLAGIVSVVSFIGASFVGALGVKTELQQSKCDASVCVSLSRQSSQPEVLTVVSGSYVKFSSADGQKHNVALIHSGIQHEDESRYESGDFNADEAWKVQFKKDGTFTFEDKYNENAEISVIVYTPGKKYEIK
ncbi:hypothetical protein H7X69_01395 [Candidatus Saccharibacteria bacterium]|nr:hypothetical protein [Candidatus Saccharibacteria bacterium]